MERFIRAPIIRRVGPAATVCATYLGDPVWVESGSLLVTTFHPELTDDPTVYVRFLEKLAEPRARVHSLAS